MRQLYYSYSFACLNLDIWTSELCRAEIEWSSHSQLKAGFFSQLVGQYSAIRRARPHNFATIVRSFTHSQNPCSVLHNINHFMYSCLLAWWFFKYFVHLSFFFAQNEAGNTLLFSTWLFVRACLFIRDNRVSIWQKSMV